MPAILAAVLQALAIIGQVYAILLQLRDLAAKGVKETIPYFVETAVREAGITLAHPTWGNHALLNAINAIGTPSVGGLAAADVANSAYAVYVLAEAIQGDYNLLDTKLDSVLSAIGGLPTPPTPPTPEEVAAGVWAATVQFPYPGNFNQELAFGTLLRYAAQAGFIGSGVSGVPLPGNPDFTITAQPELINGVLKGGGNPQPPLILPVVIDWSQLHSDDTLLTFLQRTQANLNWASGAGHFGAGGTRIRSVQAPGSNWLEITCNVTPDTFASMLATYFPPTPEYPAAAPSAPVWPGTANVTLGTPVALEDQLVVEEVMDGVLVSVTTPPSKLGSYHVGGVTLDYGVGRVTFENDEGYMEPWQYLGFREAIYTPRSMQQASKARFQVLGGAEGTVTPWTKS